MNALGGIPFLLLPITIHDNHFEILFKCANLWNFRFSYLKISS